MDGGRRKKLAANITRVGAYLPLLVRAHPELAGRYQLLDGEQRRGALLELGYTFALCLVWRCDDHTALLLLASLNQLRGDDVPVRRAELLAELSAQVPADLLALLLPEDEHEIERSLAMLDFDTESLLAAIETSAAKARLAGPQLVSFAVPPEDVGDIDRAVAAAAASLEGANRRGRALGIICRKFLEV
jgi:ParB-like chromosome segregation protein Spo0J